MKTIVALAFAALVVNACVRAGDSFYRNYQLEDAVNQEARYGDMKTASQLRRRLLSVAADKGVSLSEDEITVEKRGLETFVSLAYVESIPLLPMVYTHEQAYDITMQVQPVRPLVDDKR